MINYNHEEAIGCFMKCGEADPKCAMGWWGIAYSVSSSYNWPPGLGSGHDAIQHALTLKDGLSELEKDLIDGMRDPFPCLWFPRFVASFLLPSHSFLPFFPPSFLPTPFPSFTFLPSFVSLLSPS
jgi:hypothetical protein